MRASDVKELGRVVAVSTISSLDTFSTPETIFFRIRKPQFEIWRNKFIVNEH